MKRWDSGEEIKVKYGTRGNYRKRPVVVEAVQIEEPVKIETLEGTMEADKGDWIVRGVDGEFYPCKPDVFRKTYERVSLKETAEVEH